ncbi:hypothetical protein ZWY2020_001720 [Hordeum vulgare]|nr:hypothetical protein ZWY2020_001720 [Hordeum vulgare]
MATAAAPARAVRHQADDGEVIGAELDARRGQRCCGLAADAPPGVAAAVDGPVLPRREIATLPPLCSVRDSAVGVRGY